MDNYVDNIKLCVNDLIRYYKINTKINIYVEDIAQYVSDILREVYNDIDNINKYIYPEILEQIICYEYPYLNDNFRFNDYYNNKYNKLRVKILLEKPQAPQKSDLWHEQRKNSIGASELASIFNKNPFCSYNKYLLKKSGYETITKDDNISIHCLHGIKYEEIAQKIYCLRNKVKLYEFGSIEDEKYNWIRASPDGISDNGIMLEIKVPLVRKVYGLPPIYYWYQMQQQLNVCKLNKCDFLECKIEEYNSWDEYKQDKNNNMEKGIIIEYFNKNESDPWRKKSWIYPENIIMSLEDIYVWISKVKYDLSIDENREFSRIICWKLIQYSCFRVYRNYNWWNNNFKIIENFWNLVSRYRENGYEELIPKKRTKKIEKKKDILEQYQFLSDSE